MYIPRRDRRAYQKYKEEARRLVMARLAHFNTVYGFAWGRIAIRNQKSRWGSCSKKGNLNFSYRLALIPSPLADYIILHELCHLGEFNHSRRFWDLVERGMPDWKERRKLLR